MSRKQQSPWWKCVRYITSCTIHGLVCECDGGLVFSLMLIGQKTDWDITAKARGNQPAQVRYIVHVRVCVWERDGGRKSDFSLVPSRDVTLNRYCISLVSGSQTPLSYFLTRCYSTCVWQASSHFNQISQLGAFHSGPLLQGETQISRGNRALKTAADTGKYRGYQWVNIRHFHL